MEVPEIQTVEEVSMTEFPAKPFKIMDYHGEKRIGIVARGLHDLMDRAHIKLNIPAETPVRVALEVDGTEVEDEDYFATLEYNTALVILVGEQRWLPGTKYTRYNYWDEPDAEEKPPAPHVEKLVDHLYSDLTCITLLGGKDLELLTDMDQDCLADLIPGEDRRFLGTLKEASFKIMAEKDQAKEAMDLLKLYHSRHVAERDAAEKKEE